MIFRAPNQAHLSKLFWIDPSLIIANCITNDLANAAIDIQQEVKRSCLIGIIKEHAKKVINWATVSQELSVLIRSFEAGLIALYGC